jgi:hypothetical protein
MLLQSFWDVNRQNIRKAIDMLAGGVSGYLVSQGEWGALAAPFAVIALNYVWFYFDNRNKVTVEGLVESPVPGTNAMADTLKGVIAEAREKS